MNIDEMTYGEFKELKKVFGSGQGAKQNEPHGAVGQKCVVRTYASGVHIGEVVSVASNDGRSRCELKNSRRLHGWSGAFTLSAVALDGVDVDNSRFSAVVPQIFIEDAIEFIPASESAWSQLMGSKSHEF